MISYRIYLTKSSEVASMLAAAVKVGANGVTSVSYGQAYPGKFDCIPPMYCDNKTYACVVEYDNEKDVPEYRIVFA